MYTRRFATFIFVLAAGCASQRDVSLEPDAAERSPAPRAVEAAASSNTANSSTTAATGKLYVSISDVLGRDKRARVELNSETLPESIVIPIEHGKAEWDLPQGTYDAYVYVYDPEPIMVEIESVTIEPNETAYLVHTQLEGAGGSRKLRDFDQDYDGVLDRVELAAGTNPADPTSIPGESLLPFNPEPLDDEMRWFRGEFHARSKYGGGSESVGELVRRAEKLDLDFLAITDRNTMAAASDPDFKSKSVVLIPAMEWGSDENGVALVYGPRTLPRMPSSREEAQAECLKIQAQGGVVAVAHPCFPTAPWQWGLSYMNAVEVWCRDWRGVPPILPDVLNQDLLVRNEGQFVHSIARAASAVGLSANGQASEFYDLELARGLKAGLIAGSLSSSPKVAMAEPVTYVFAREKSLPAILEGLRNGRTFVSSGLDGPLLYFGADSDNDGTENVNIGGVIPVGAYARFIVAVQRAKGKKLQVLENGRPILTKEIPGDSMLHRFWYPITRYSVFRVRVIDTPDEMAFGILDVHALTSPIYAQTIDLVDPLNPDQNWVPFASGPAFRQPELDLELPNDTRIGELIPTWRMRGIE